MTKGMEDTFQKGEPLVTGAAWNAWVKVDQLQTHDPWVCAVPESEDETKEKKKGQETGKEENGKGGTKERTRVQRTTTPRGVYVQRPEEAFQGCLRPMPEPKSPKSSDEDVHSDEDQEAKKQRKLFNSCLKGMKLHTLDDKIGGIAKGQKALEGWVKDLIDGIEERVTNAFASQQEMIDKAEDRVDAVEDEVDEMKKETKERFESMSEEIAKYNETLKELKKSIEDIRSDQEGSKTPQWPQARAQTQGSGRTPPQVQNRIRVGGWSPYGSPVGSRITKEDTEKLQGNISRLFSKQQKAAWRWDRPWLTNFQTILFVEGASDSNEVFKARAELQKIVDENDITVKGRKSR